jgi:uncharacterized membrane protein YbhN (UPF0104 family)
MVNTKSSFPYPARASKAAALSRRLVWRILKWTLFVLVIVFVGKQGYELWNEDNLQHIEINFIWLVPALGVYLLGGLPAVWFWRKLMRSFGGDVSFRDSLRAYYCSQLGKYIPGKATVLFIRAGMIKGRGLGVAAATITATCETLMMMGAGLAIAMTLSPIIGWPNWIRSIPFASIVVPVGIVLCCLVALRVIAFILSNLVRTMISTKMLRFKKELDIPAKEIGYGLLAFVITWILFGLSLGLTIRSISGDLIDFGDWPIWIGAVSAATSIGFIAIFAPGGLGVREGLLWMVLSLHIPEKQAMAAAVLLRLVWLVAEITAASVLYYIISPSKNDERGT